MKEGKLMVLGLSLVAALVARSASLTDFDPRMAIAKSTVTNGVKWIDGKDLPIEGRVFDDVENYYDRLPAKAVVNGGVKYMKHYTAGEQFRFATDAKKLSFRWQLFAKDLESAHFCRMGMSGIDVYRFDAKRGRWFHAATGAPQSFEKGGSIDVDWIPGEACLVNLPLYNGLTSFKAGIATNACIVPLPPRKNGMTKPVVFYGTSITHGGCASRPGMSFVNRVGRDLDVPVVNLGFSGSGHMEMEMTEHLGRIDASCYVLDCLWNMWSGEIEKNYEPFIRKLRALRPGVPIVMAERCDMRYRDDGTGDPNFVQDHAFVRALYDKLVKEGWKNLVYLPSEKQQFIHDGDGTVDTCHPNDYGMMQMAKGFGDAVAEALIGSGALTPRGLKRATKLSKEWKDVFAADLSNAETEAGAWTRDKDGCLVPVLDKPLLTKDWYERFEVEAVYAMGPKGNSGLYVYNTVHPYEKIEIQMQDDLDPEVAKGQKPYQLSGAIYGHQAAFAKAAKKAGEWNVMRVIADGKKVRVVLNGVETAHADLSAFKSATENPEGSKIPPYMLDQKPLATIPTMGRVGFQGLHVGGAAGVRIKSFRIRSL